MFKLPSCRVILGALLFAASLQAHAISCGGLTLEVRNSANTFQSLPLQVGESPYMILFTGRGALPLAYDKPLPSKSLTYTINFNDEATVTDTREFPIYEDQGLVNTFFRGFNSPGIKKITVTMPNAMPAVPAIPNCNATEPTVATIMVEVVAPPDVKYSTTAFTGLWWNPKTSGQGIFFSQNAPFNIAFIGWFTYDQNGKAKWYVGDRCIMGNNATCSTKLYETKGAIFNGTDFSNANLRLNEVGEASFSFATAQEATMRYTLKGVVGKMDLVRQSF